MATLSARPLGARSLSRPVAGAGLGDGRGLPLGKTWHLVTARTSQTFAAANTFYLLPDGRMDKYTKRQNCELVADVDYQWSGLRALVFGGGAGSANTLTQTATIRSMVNGQYGNQVLRIRAGAAPTPGWDQQGVDRLRKGDHFCYEVKLTGTGSMSCNLMQSILTQVMVPGQLEHVYCGGFGAGEAAVSVASIITQDNLWGYIGAIGGGATLGAWDYTQRYPRRVVGFHGYTFAANTIDQGGTQNQPLRSGSSYTSPINNPAGFIGQIDLGLYIDYLTGDKEAWRSQKYGGASSGTYQAGAASVSYQTPDGHKLYEAGFSKASPTFDGFPFNVTGYLPLHGETNVTNAGGYSSESAAQTYIYVPTRFRHMTVHAPATGAHPGNNINTGTIVCTLRVDGVDTALTVSVPAGNTTELTDLLHTVDVPAGHFVNWKVVVPGASGMFGGGFIRCEGLSL